jgi:hypothetical protein
MALARADWQQPGQITPWTVFLQLGLKKEDGWAFPTSAKAVEDYHKAAQAWLRDHAETYHIRRIVGSESPDKTGPEGSKK